MSFDKDAMNFVTPENIEVSFDDKSELFKKLKEAEKKADTAKLLNDYRLYTEREISEMMRYFQYDHLPPHLQECSKPFYDLAEKMIGQLGPQRETVAFLRKLLEAKDCAVRAAL